MILDDRTTRGDGVGPARLAGAQRRERASAVRVRMCAADDGHRSWRAAPVTMAAGSDRGRAQPIPSIESRSNQERRIMAETQAAGPTTGHRVATDG
jgi:hypothetical protein